MVDEIEELNEETVSPKKQAPKELTDYQIKDYSNNLFQNVLNFDKEEYEEGEFGKELLKLREGLINRSKGGQAPISAQRFKYFVEQSSPTTQIAKRIWQEAGANFRDLGEGIKLTEQGFVDVESVKDTKYARWARLFDGKTAHRAKVLQMQLDDVLDKEKITKDLGFWGHLGYGTAGFAIAAAIDPINSAIGAASWTTSWMDSIVKMGLMETAIQTGQALTDETKTAKERVFEGAVNTAVFAGMHGIITGVKKFPVGAESFKKVMGKFNPNERANAIAEEVNEPFTKGFGKPMEPSAKATEGSLSEMEISFEEATKLKSHGSASGSIINALKGGDTTLGLALSESETVRTLNQSLVHLEEGTRGDLLGLGRTTPIQIEAANMKDTYRRSLEEILKEGLEASGLSRIEFETELGRAVHVEGKSANPAITKAAKKLHKQIFEPLLLDAKKAEVPIRELALREGESYFPRRWSQDAIAKDPQGAAEAINIGGRRRFAESKKKLREFQTLRKEVEAGSSLLDLTAVEQRIELHTEMKQDLRRSLKRIERNIENSEYKAELEGMRFEVESNLQDLEKRLELDQAILKAQDIRKGLFDDVEKILKKEIKRNKWKDERGMQIVVDMMDGMLREDGLRVGGSGIRRERALDFVPHELTSPYINLDVEGISLRHIDQMSREIVLAKRLGGYFSDFRESGFADAVKRELQEAGKKAGWTFEKTAKITAKQLDDLNALLQIVRGTFVTSGGENYKIRMGERILNGYLHMTKMGMGALTQAVDFVMPIREIGMRNFLGEAFMQSVEGLSGFAKKLTKAEKNPELIKDFLNIFAEETSRFASDLQLQAFQLKPRSWISRGAAYAYEGFQRATFMRKMEHAVYNFHAKSIYNFLQKTLRKGRFTQSEIEFLSRHGISLAEANKMHLTAKAGKRTSMGWIADYSMKHHELIRSAVRAGTDSLSLNPKRYVVPKSFQKSMLLRVASKYKSYLFMLNRRVLISGINNKNANYLWLMGALFASESIAKTLKGVLGGKGIPAGSEIVKDGLKGSGVFGLLAPGVDVADGVFYGKGLEENMSRLAPALGTLQDATVATNAFANPQRRGKSLTKKEARAVKRLTPFNNLLGVGRLWNEAIDDNF